MGVLKKAASWLFGKPDQAKRPTVQRAPQQASRDKIRARIDLEDAQDSLNRGTTGSQTSFTTPDQRRKRRMTSLGGGGVGPKNLLS